MLAASRPQRTGWPRQYQLRPLELEPPCSNSPILRPKLPPLKSTSVWLPAAAVFGLQGQRSAERVQPEQRVRARHQRHFRNGDSRDEVPAHHVAERLIEPDSVHVDRDALRRAEQRRGGVAAIVRRRAGRDCPAFR